MVAEARPVAPGLFAVGTAGPVLIAARCEACGKLQFPAAPTCPYCAGEQCAEVRVGPAAQLWLYTAVHARPPGYRGPVPYGFGIVELADGLRVVTRLTECRLERLRPGMPMRLVVDGLCSDDAGAPVLSYAFAPERG